MAAGDSGSGGSGGSGSGGGGGGGGGGTDAPMVGCQQHWLAAEWDYDERCFVMFDNEHALMQVFVYVCVCVRARCGAVVLSNT